MTAAAVGVGPDDPRLLPRLDAAAIERVQRNAPAELLAAPVWVCGDRAPRELADGSVRSSKVPLSPVRRGNAKSNDPRTWGTFEQARERALFPGQNYGCCALGVNLHGGPWVGLDLDHVLVDGELVPEARALLDALPATYTEVSPSGDGLRLFYRGELPAAFRGSEVADAFGDSTQIEAYDGTRGGRYLTVTGRVFEDRSTMVDAANDELQPLVELQQSKSKVATVLRKLGGTVVSTTPTAPADESDEPEPAATQPTGTSFVFAASEHIGAAARDDHAIDLDRARWGLLDAQLLDPSARYPEWLRVLAACKALDARELAVEWSRRSGKFVDGEVDAKWEGLTGSSDGALFGMFDDASPTWRDDYEAARGRRTTTSASATAGVAADDTSAHDGAWPTLNLDELVKQPPVKWLVDGMLPLASVTILGGSPAVGKSYLALDLAMRLAHGCDEWMGAELLGHGPVVYLALEGTAGLAGRARAWRKHHEGEKPQHELLVVNPLGASADGAPPLTEKQRKRTLQQLRKLHEQLNGKLALVIIDTLTLSIEGDENSSEAMRPALRLASQVAAEFGCAVLLIHHIRKEQAKKERESKAPPALGDLRGSGALGGNVDQVLLAWRKQTDGEDGERFLRVAKAKDGDEGAPIRFELDAVQTGEQRNDGSDKAEVACVVRHVGRVNRRDEAAKVKAAKERDEHDRKQALVDAAGKLTESVGADELCSRAGLSPGKNGNRYLPGVLADEGRLARRGAGSGHRYGTASLIEHEVAEAEALKAARAAERAACRAAKAQGDRP